MASATLVRNDTAEESQFTYLVRDVALMMHTHLLSPVKFANDIAQSQRYGKLAGINDFPLSHLLAKIQNNKHNPDKSLSTSFPTSHMVFSRRLLTLYTSRFLQWFRLMGFLSKYVNRSRSPQLNVSFSLFSTFDRIPNYYLELFEPHPWLFLHLSRAATAVLTRLPERARWWSPIGEVERYVNVYWVSYLQADPTAALTGEHRI